MTPEIVTLEFEVTQVVAEDWNRIDVYCPGTGLAERKRFGRGSVSINQRLDPYALVANEWFENHPEPKVWKVGDVVPAGTVVGRLWTAAPIRTKREAQRQCAEGAGYGILPQNTGPFDKFREDRTILWIQP